MKRSAKSCQILLRDSVYDDLADYRRWFSDETEWAKTDAPWEPLRTPAEMVARITRRLDKGFPEPRTRLEICTLDGVHIGSVVSYCRGKKDAKQINVGLDICDPSYWGKGIGEKALKLWMAYLFDRHGVEQLYCGTWSGNPGMVRLAEKCGFSVCRRNLKARKVGGELYDGLGFVASRKDFFDANPELLTLPRALSSL